MTIFVTGGGGFIGSEFVRQWVESHPGETLINFCTVALVFTGASLLMSTSVITVALVYIDIQEAADRKAQQP